MIKFYTMNTQHILTRGMVPALLILGILGASSSIFAWDAAGRFDGQGNYKDPIGGHTAACLRYESSFVGPATIGGQVNGLEMEQRLKAQLADTQPGAKKRETENSVITINPNVIPTQKTTHWMIHHQNGHMFIGGGQ